MKPLALISETVVAVSLLGCAGMGEGSFTLRLDSATISHDLNCGDDSDGSWDGADNAPDPTVLITDNASGKEWRSSELQEEWEPEWNQAVFDKDSMSAEDLQEWGVTVSLLEVDGFDEDAIVDSSYRLRDDDLESLEFEVSNDCGTVYLSLLTD